MVLVLSLYNSIRKYTLYLINFILPFAKFYLPKGLSKFDFNFRVFS